MVDVRVLEAARVHEMKDAVSEDRVDACHKYSERD